MLKLKDKAYKKFLKTKSNKDYLYYKSLRNYVTSAIRSEKKSYIQHVLNISKNSPKKLWANLKKLNIHQTSKPSIPLNLCEPNAINYHFINCLTTPVVDKHLLQFYRNHLKEDLHNKPKFTFTQVTEAQLSQIIASLKSNAQGIDDINLKLLKLVAPYCIGSLTDVINNSLLQSMVPEVWKKSIIVPIPKVSNPSSLTELRPISVLPTMSKVLEKVIYDQLSLYANENILPSIQSGFKSCHSTNTALLKITNDIAKAMDQSEVTILILLDYSKAFDIINHELLLAKLYYYGLSDSAINWFENYLSNRSQIVKAGGQLSNEMSITKGVPQGSILGPLLFTIFTSDLPAALSGNCSLHLYADDTQLYKSCLPTDINETVLSINTDLQNIVKWSAANGLIINSSKTVALCIGLKVTRERACQSLNTSIMIGGSSVNFSACAKNLGVWFDSNLNFELHVTKLLQSAYIKFRPIYKFKHILPSNVKWSLVNTIILSHLNYCSAVYFSFLNAHFKHKLQMLQNSCLRFSFNVNYSDHVTPFYINLSILKLNEAFCCQFIMTVYNVLKSGKPLYLFNLLQQRSDIHSVNIRFKNMFNLPTHKTTKFECSFEYKAPSLLNKFHSTIFIDSGARNVKSNLKKQLLLLCSAPS